MKRGFLETIGVLMVRKDIVKGQRGRVHSGHMGARKGRTGPVQQKDGWKRGRRKQIEKRLGDWTPASKPPLGRHMSITL